MWDLLALGYVIDAYYVAGSYVAWTLTTPEVQVSVPRWGEGKQFAPVSGALNLGPSDAKELPLMTYPLSAVRQEVTAAPKALKGDLEEKPRSFTLMAVRRAALH